LLGLVLDFGLSSIWAIISRTTTIIKCIITIFRKKSKTPFYHTSPSLSQFLPSSHCYGRGRDGECCKRRIRKKMHRKALILKSFFGTYFIMCFGKLSYEIRTYFRYGYFRKLILESFYKFRKVLFQKLHSAISIPKHILYVSKFYFGSDSENFLEILFLKTLFHEYCSKNSIKLISENFKKI